MESVTVTLDPKADSRLPGLLKSAADSFEALGPAGLAFQTALQRQSERLMEGRFHLAVLGQFKRGKSPFIYTMLGAPLLPMVVVPLMALPTFIRWESLAEAKVQFLDGHSPEQGPSLPGETLQAFLERFVTEAGNPRNQKGVAKAWSRSKTPDLSLPSTANWEGA